MSRPWRHPKTGVWHYRARPPADLLSKVRGRTIAFDIVGVSRRVTVGEFLKVSLGTKDDGEARILHTAVEAQVEKRWAAERSAAVELSGMEISALAGAWYRELVAEHEANPGSADGWEIYQDQFIEGLAYLDPESDGTEREPYDPETAHKILRNRVRLDEWLETRGLLVAESSRRKLEAEVAYALVLAANTLQRRARGDFGPDEHIARFASNKLSNLSCPV